MQLLWMTGDGHLLWRGAPQPSPFGDAAGVSPFDQTHDFDRVDPRTGEVLEAYRRRFSRFEQQDAWHFTGHLVEGDTLVEVLLRVQVPEHHGARTCDALGNTALLTGLVPRSSRRWACPDGRHLIEGPPQATAYGHNPPCHLLDGLHDYALADPATGAVVGRFGRSDVVLGYGDDEALTRHRVEEDTLVEYVFDYFEDSCWGTGEVRGHERRVRLEGLVALPEGPPPGAPPGRAG